MARLSALAALGALCLVLSIASPVNAQEPPPPPAPPGAAWILVDADTGSVLQAHDERTAMPPASTIKILTALVALQRLPANDGIPISALAEGMPARKISVKAGQVWDREDLLYSMMLVSANDAAVALAERIGGSLDGYQTVAEHTAERLGLEDPRDLSDPSGLDDAEFSHEDGSRISARDLAIVARAALAEPELMSIVATPEYHFRGGDSINHVVRNHDRFLDLYPGATGLKTGLTDLAGRCFVASATRNGRTMLAVVLDAPDIYAAASRMLDQGFATSVAAQGGLDHLPEVVADASLQPVPAPGSALVAPGREETGGSALAPSQADGSEGLFDSTPATIGLLVIGGAPALVVLRRRQVVRRRAFRGGAPPSRSPGRP
jgi:D-alanyl-D-alanine carboxypeptidase (penicillin-binding protein 5/6)